MSGEQQQQLQQHLAFIQSLQRVPALPQQLPNPQYHAQAPLATIVSGSVPVEDDGDLQTKRRVHLAKVWDGFLDEIRKDGPKMTHEFPLARIRKIMKSDEDVKLIKPEVLGLFDKACEYFIRELTAMAWRRVESDGRKTIQKADIEAAVCDDSIYDFLIDIVPRPEPNQPKVEAPKQNLNAVAGLPAGSSATANAFAAAFLSLSPQQQQQLMTQVALQPPLAQPQAAALMTPNAAIASKSQPPTPAQLYLVQQALSARTPVSAPHQSPHPAASSPWPAKNLNYTSPNHANSSAGVVAAGPAASAPAAPVRMIQQQHLQNQASPIQQHHYQQHQQMGQAMQPPQPGGAAGAHNMENHTHQSNQVQHSQQSMAASSSSSSSAQPQQLQMQQATTTNSMSGLDFLMDGETSQMYPHADELDSVPGFSDPSFN